MLTLEVLPIADWVADLVEWVTVHDSYISRFGRTLCVPLLWLNIWVSELNKSSNVG